jgi:hypothetical protein
LKSEKSLLPSQGDDMKIHPGVKPAVWGAVAGAVVLTVVGFSSLGWTLGSTAERMATQSALDDLGHRQADPNGRSSRRERNMAPGSLELLGSRAAVSARPHRTAAEEMRDAYRKELRADSGAGTEAPQPTPNPFDPAGRFPDSAEKAATQWSSLQRVGERRQHRRAVARPGAAMYARQHGRPSFGRRAD